MPRPPRLQYPGAIYHLVTRGDGRRTLFHDDGHYARFTQGLSDEVSRSGLLLDAKSRSCADQNPRAEFVPRYVALAFGICVLGMPNEIDGLLQRCENCPNDLD